MNKLVLLLATTLLCLPLGAQKIKLKKDEVLVDKVPVLKFPQTSGKGFGPKDYAVLSMTGDTLMVFDAIEVIYDPLPHEKGPRSGGFYAVADLRFADRTETITFFPRGFQDRIVACMKKSGILEPAGLQSDKVSAFVKELRPQDGREVKQELSIAGKFREKNAARVAAEVGRHQKRKPAYTLTISGGDISDSGKVVGSWVKKPSKNGLNYYSVKMANGKTLATVVHDPKTYELVVATFDDEEYVTSQYGQDVPSEKIAEIARYLINYGYL